ncbi:MAG: helix-turn-helix transcriptional regulator [Clostridia bacterium]|nr:helix-turn-helix transcriptional regulator [Clostridia bacterium]
MNIDTQTITFLRCAEYHSPPCCLDDHSSSPRPYSSFGFFLDGDAVCTSGDNAFSLSAGDIIFTPIGSTYTLQWERPECRYLTIHFICHPTAEPFGTHTFPVQKLTGLLGMRSHFEAAVVCDNDPHRLYESLSHVYSVFAAVCPRLAGISRSDLHSAVYPAVHYLDEHYTEPITVESLAQMCSLSTSYFYRCFRSVTGQSPITYKNNALIRHAARLLLDDRSMSIEEISDTLGFESSIYFRRVFKAIMGKSPREYRKTEQL